MNVHDALSSFEKLHHARCGITTCIHYKNNDLENSFFKERMHGSMAYMEEHRELKRSLENVLPGARSVVSCAFAYPSPTDTPVPIAGYAWGPDYHARVRSALGELARLLGLEEGTYRICVDSCPVPERSVAVQAGLGWIGRSGNLIVPGMGPNVVLGELVCTQELPELMPFTVNPGPDTCGKCHECELACPTGAIQGGGLVDARLCLSYHTTESRDFPPDSALEAWDVRVFGCDECVSVCPYTNHAFSAPDFEPLFTTDTLPDAVVFTKKHLRGTAMERLSGWRFMRNVALALGSHPDGQEALERLLSHPHEQVRRAALTSLKRRT